MGGHSFEQVGPKVPYGEVALSADAAEAFRQLALQGVKIKRLELTDEQTHILTASYASGALLRSSMFSFVENRSVADSSFYSRTILGRHPDYWRSVISFARFKQADYESKFYNIYEVESFGGEPTMAVRRVKVLRNLSRLAFNDEGEPFEDIYSRERKAFERPMTDEDVDKITGDVDRVLRRLARTTQQ